MFHNNMERIIKWELKLNERGFCKENMASCKRDLCKVSLKRSMNLYFNYKCQLVMNKGFPNWRKLLINEHMFIKTNHIRREFSIFFSWICQNCFCPPRVHQMWWEVISKTSRLSATEVPQVFPKCSFGINAIARGWGSLLRWRAWK